MPPSLKNDLKQLDQLAYHRREWSESEVRRYHGLLEEKGAAVEAELATLYRWLFVPITLWPMNVQDVFSACLERMEQGKSLGTDLRLLVLVLPDLPDPEVCRTVSEHEKAVEKGHYENLVRTPAKFDSIAKDVERNPNLKQQWKEICARWDVKKLADHKGVLRRSLSPERNLRGAFSVNWRSKSARFQAVFDAFCARWNLYGMQGDTPLTIKLSVNLTPHGTMIFIPAYWSFDSKRDIHWNAVMELHRSRALKKQGENLAEGTEQRRKDAIELRKLEQQADQLKLKGSKRHSFLCYGLKWVEETDKKRFRRLRQEFPEIR